MSARRCHCGALVQFHENGDVSCMNGHSQPEAVGSLVRAVAELVGGPLRELRATIEEHTDELRSLRTEVNVLTSVLETAPAEPAAMVGMDEMCRLLGANRDWMYRDDRRRRLGGYQNGKNGRWRFDPDRTRALFESLYGERSGEDPRSRAGARAATSRQLPTSVPLLEVKGRAA